MDNDDDRNLGGHGLTTPTKSRCDASCRRCAPPPSAPISVPTTGRRDPLAAALSTLAAPPSSSSSSPSSSASDASLQQHDANLGHTTTTPQRRRRRFSLDSPTSPYPPYSASASSSSSAQSRPPRPPSQARDDASEEAPDRAAFRSALPTGTWHLVPDTSSGHGPSESTRSRNNAVVLSRAATTVWHAYLHNLLSSLHWAASASVAVAASVSTSSPANIASTSGGSLAEPLHPLFTTATAPWVEIALTTATSLSESSHATAAIESAAIAAEGSAAAAVGGFVALAPAIPAVLAAILLPAGSAVVRGAVRAVRAAAEANRLAAVADAVPAAPNDHHHRDTPSLHFLPSTAGTHRRDSSASSTSSTGRRNCSSCQHHNQHQHHGTSPNRRSSRSRSHSRDPASRTFLAGIQSWRVEMTIRHAAARAAMAMPLATGFHHTTDPPYYAANDDGDDAASVVSSSSSAGTYEEIDSDDAAPPVPPVSPPDRSSSVSGQWRIFAPRALASMPPQPQRELPTADAAAPPQSRTSARVHILRQAADGMLPPAPLVAAAAAASGTGAHRTDHHDDDGGAAAAGRVRAHMRRMSSSWLTAITACDPAATSAMLDLASTESIAASPVPQAGAPAMVAVAPVRRGLPEAASDDGNDDDSAVGESVRWSVASGIPAAAHAASAAASTAAPSSAYGSMGSARPPRPTSSLRRPLSTADHNDDADQRRAAARMSWISTATAAPLLPPPPPPLGAGSAAAHALDAVLEETSNHSNSSGPASSLVVADGTATERRARRLDAPAPDLWRFLAGIAPPPAPRAGGVRRTHLKAHGNALEATSPPRRPESVLGGLSLAPPPPQSPPRPQPKHRTRTPSPKATAARTAVPVWRRRRRRRRSTSAWVGDADEDDQDPASAAAGSVTGADTNSAVGTASVVSSRWAADNTIHEDDDDGTSEISVPVGSSSRAGSSVVRRWRAGLSDVGEEDGDASPIAAAPSLPLKHDLTTPTVEQPPEQWAAIDAWRERVAPAHAGVDGMRRSHTRGEDVMAAPVAIAATVAADDLAAWHARRSTRRPEHPSSSALFVMDEDHHPDRPHPNGRGGGGQDDEEVDLAPPASRAADDDDVVLDDAAAAANASAFVPGASREDVLAAVAYAQAVALPADSFADKRSDVAMATLATQQQQYPSAAAPWPSPPSLVHHQHQQRPQSMLVPIGLQGRPSSTGFSTAADSSYLATPPSTTPPNQPSSPVILSFASFAAPVPASGTATMALVPSSPRRASILRSSFMGGSSGMLTHPTAMSPNAAAIASGLGASSPPMSRFHGFDHDEHGTDHSRLPVSAMSLTGLPHSPPPLGINPKGKADTTTALAAVLRAAVNDPNDPRVQVALLTREARDAVRDARDACEAEFAVHFALGVRLGRCERLVAELARDAAAADVATARLDAAVEGMRALVDLL